MNKIQRIWFQLCLGLFALVLLASVGIAHAAEAAPAAPAAEPPKLMGKMITLSDFGAEDLAYLALPQQPPVGGVVVVHDRWGLDENTKRLVDALADRGYLALAVDIYNGRTTNDVNQANVLVANMRLESAMKTIQAGIQLLKESPRLRVPRTAVVGYSSGGTVALIASQQIKDIDAVACLNAVIAPRDKKISKYRVPICLVFPRAKDGDMIAGLDDFQNLMSGMKNPLEVQFVQPAFEGFADPRNPSYDAAAAEKGWKLVDEFLKRELSKPPKEPTLIDKVEDFFK